MKNDIFKFFLISIITIILSGCGADTTSTTYDSSKNSTTFEDSSSYQPDENAIASTVTSFAQDLKLYDIADLDDNNLKKAYGYDDSSDDSSDDDSSDDSSDDDSSDDSSDDDSSDDSSDDDSSDDSSDDDSSDDSSSDDSSDDSSSDDSSDDSSSDGSSDNSSSDDSSDDGSSDDSSDDDSSDDSSDDDSSDDGSSDDSSDNGSSDSSDKEESTESADTAKVVEPVEVINPDMENPYSNFSDYDNFKGKDDDSYQTLGTTNVTLNNKSYNFKIAKDNFQERVQTPTFTSIEDGAYTISIVSYIITDDDVLKKEDGIFTLTITVPNLNTSGSYKVEANVLTNSAQDDVYAIVNISNNENGISFDATVAEFQVFNRDKTKSYPANFTVQYHSK